MLYVALFLTGMLVGGLLDVSCEEGPPALPVGCIGLLVLGILYIGKTYL